MSPANPPSQAPAPVQRDRRVLTNPIFRGADSVVTNRQTDGKLSRLRLAYVFVIGIALRRQRRSMRRQDVASSRYTTSLPGQRNITVRLGAALDRKLGVELLLTPTRDAGVRRSSASVCECLSIHTIEPKRLKIQSPNSTTGSPS